jgi:hypothetical protein
MCVIIMCMMVTKTNIKNETEYHQAAEKLRGGL